MVDSAVSSAAPGALEFVRSFVNSRDIDAGTDQWATPAGWAAWARGHGIDASTSPEELAAAASLRETLREALAANHERRPLPPAAVAALDGAARRFGEVTFTPTGMALVEPGTGTGTAAAVVRLLNATAAALADGTWRRLKVCAYDSCRWAFYDQSRSRTGRWCSMELCGNRAKQARWRLNRA